MSAWETDAGVRTGSAVGGKLFKGTPDDIETWEAKEFETLPAETGVGLVVRQQVGAHPVRACTCASCCTPRPPPQRTVPTIPAKAETVIWQGRRERNVFGTRSVRLPAARVSAAQRGDLRSSAETPHACAGRRRPRPRRVL